MKYNKICLVIPPSAFLLDERVFPFLGIIKVAAVLENFGVYVEVLDLSGVSNYQEVVDKHATTSNIKLYGITATTAQIPAADKINSVLKNNFKKTILGGTHVTLANAAAKRDTKLLTRAKMELHRLKTKYDYLVIGDGELAIFQALNDVQKVIDADDLDSEFFINKDMIDHYPFPARHLIDLDSYHYYIDGERATSLISQLGCPFGCTFCAGRNSAFLRTARIRSTESIIEELRFIYQEYGYTGYMFYDDELNVNPQFPNLLKKIMELSDELGVQFKLRGFLKAELFTEEQAKLMYQAGFRWLLTGFESGSERILININKRATRDDNTRAVEYAKKYDLKVKALMSLGHAGESYETAYSTANWLKEVEPDDFDITIITPYPGSPYYDEAKIKDLHYVYTHPKTGDKLYMEDVNYHVKADYYKGIPGEYKSYVWTDYMNKQDLIDARDNIERQIRTKLGIPFNASGEANKIKIMGELPDHILRRSYDGK